MILGLLVINICIYFCVQDLFCVDIVCEMVLDGRIWRIFEMGDIFLYVIFGDGVFMIYDW